MNLEKIKKIVNSGNSNWDKLLIVELSKDPNVIPIIMNLLAAERSTNEKLLMDTNAELSRALVTILDENYGKTEGKQKAYIDRIWVAAQIKDHYLKWKEFIKCCFKIEGLP